ncbi:Molybdenum cofactor sulfurase [Fulvia fulva]|uniref:Molybdenum cofactor sulfurase n=1 Tax=Passalora fulva TaxID=5499 RepID=A0A9Q8L704_PASFU|nr:Molybdenum cofactor sulfurase [Fulvia fulva]KAK4636128.1 Molybdenum cofactor sulfurase [Fulvia fulva]KAK4636526.1 Molybdenum cofactor sulfurase [Fulvia fulva]UJO11995.1 Molybdenum cofactor sulfurase [Fulvia fulva]WPV08947.1 Molybdenum cofactor sulfurase [Fulvia fulva]WPV23449.1 Molybdenum cofactor sulfurase [Fulvia fulva]
MMDIPAHILDAVQTTDLSQSKSLETGSRTSRTSPFSSRFPGMIHDAHSSAEDVSTTSDSDQHGYQTDFTTPASSDSNFCPGDMQPDDVEDFRDREYPQLKGKTYLDHGGTTLYAKSMIEEFSADMISNLYGNPHSASTPSAIAGHRVDEIRERALRFFNADPEEFDLVFVANATAAIKLVIDCFKDHAAASNTPVWYGYHRDAHTSLVGVRESTKMHRCFTSDEEVDIWINSGGLGGPRARQLGLFAYPGQSNMTGRRLPLSWPSRIRKSFHKAATYTLLDAAALASTAPLDLADPATAPDFVALSFYKIFGFPNIGALIVRKESAHVLESRKYFGGGTVEMIISINDTWHAKKDTSIHDRLEDGTLPFHSIFALDHAMNAHERLYGPNPMKFISMHTAQLGRQLYDGIAGLKHANGAPLCRIYKDEAAVYGDPSMQGSTIAFNVQKSDGTLVGFEDVEEAADERNIYVRSGSLCNPGGVATYLGWSPAEMKAAYAAGHRCTNPTQVMLGKPTGVVRVSLGAMSTAGDVNILLHFLDEVYVEKTIDPRSATTAQHASMIFAPAKDSVISTTFTPPPPLDIRATRKNSFLSATGTPSTAKSFDMGDSKSWEAGSGAPPTPDRIDIARPKLPPFVPADYVKLRKPWEAEMRQNAANYAMEFKVRELEDASMFSRNPTPSVKARRFGRSVVNLLRTKSHVGAGADQRHDQPPLPAPA